ncbi:MAG: carbohydrate-binding domain-containing protein, partial [Clostridia bacterium]|nr:carbohydrate-binding domain-containing protein [Clostridia bacterium]
MKRFLLILLVISLVCTSLGGCGKKNEENVLINDDVPSGPVEVDFSQNDADMFTDRDTKTEYDEKNCIKIELQGNTAVASSNSVNVSEGKVTITQEATYVISGTLDDGMIIVNAPEDAKLQLVFNGVNITSKTSAPLYIIEADKVFVTLADGTDNILSSGETFVAIDENNIDAAIFSKQDLTFNGMGSLTVRAPAGHGIVSKDDLVITGGTYNITSASHGLDANDSVRIKDAAITVDAGKDGIHAENTDDTSLGFVYLSSGNIKIEAEGDGISSGSYMQIENG